MAVIQRPNAVGLMLCRMVIIEEKTHNVTLANTFQYLKVPSFPTPYMPFVVYSVLTDGLGPINLDLAISRCDTLEPIYTRSAVITFRDPLKQLRMRWQIRSCFFPAPGRYQVGLTAEDVLITEGVLTLM